MKGCLTCKQRHLKCDKAEPHCVQCLKSGRACAYPIETPERIRFQHGQNPSRQIEGPLRYGESSQVFSPDQPWVDVPGKDLVFEDVTAEIASEYVDTSTSRRLPEHVRRDSRPRSSPVNQVVMGVRSSIRSQSSSSINDLLNPGVPSFPAGPHPVPSPLSSISSTVDGREKPQLSRLFLGEPQLTAQSEAYLLRHFGAVIGPWLEICDYERQFSVVVVSRSTSCPLLLFACLAMAAHHLAQTQGSSSHDAAEYYHERCIELLIPMINSPNFEQYIDVLLASTVILRLFEQMSSSEPSHDRHRHLLGGSAFVNAQVDCAVSGGLTEASFWAFVIQDIQFALAYQTPLRMHFHVFNEKLQRAWRNERNLTERSWTKRAIWLLAETIQYCYSDEPSRPRSEYVYLKQRIEEWERSRPDSFRPLFVAPADPARGKAFPTVWHSHSWHVAATQHICMARILLLTCEPGRVKMGLGSGREQLSRLHAHPPPHPHPHPAPPPPPPHPGSVNSLMLAPRPRAPAAAAASFQNLLLTDSQEQVDECSSVLFGAALSTDDAPARFAACHAVCASGPWIRDRGMQAALLTMLRRTEAEHGWPWRYIVDELVLDWGWPLERPPPPPPPHPLLVRP